MHEGHRERMRARYIESGLANFAPHEVLELMLFYCIPQKNVNPLAHELLSAFGSLHGVFEATPAQLMQVKGIGENAAVFLSLVPEITRRYQASRQGELPEIKNRLAAEKYCEALFIGHKTEHFYLVALNSAMRVIGNALIAKGSLTQVPAYPRVVMEATLSLNAHSVILCHNHPGGTLSPSDSDLFLTARLARVLKDVDVTLLDHLIVTVNGVISLSKEGYFTSSDAETFQMAADSSQRLIKNTIRKEDQAP